MAREMKDSGIEWIGEIPRHWNVRPIKNSFSIVSGSTPDSDKAEYWEGDIPWITPADFKTIDKYTSGGSRFITEKGYDSCSTNMIPKGSIIFSKRAPIGSVVINKIDLCTNQGCLSCIKNDKTDSAYFYYLMSIYDDVFNLFGSGTTFKEISATTFGDFILPLPPLVEQQLVSSFLDSKCAEIDKAIDATKASIEEYRKLRQAIITETVTKGLDPDVEMKDSGIEWIGEIPEDSKIIRLKKIVAIPVTDGTHNTPEYASEENGSPFLSSKDVTKGYIDWANIKYITRDLHEILYKETRPQKNDILLAKNGTTGIAALNDTDKVFDIYVTLALIRPNTSIVLPKYLQYCINSDISKRQFNEHLIGIGVPNLHLNVIENTKVILHNKQSQQHIIEYLDTKCAEIDSLIKSKEKIIEELTAYRKSLIFEYVTGKKEVSVEPA